MIDWICSFGVSGCDESGVFLIRGPNGKKQRERWVGGPFEGAKPPRNIPGGDWKWYPDKGNSRGGVWRDPQGKTANWDPDGHWDVEDGEGHRTRYTNRGIPTNNHTPPNGKPRLPKPIARLGRRAIKALGPIAWLIWLDQVMSDPSILREDNFCTAGNCVGLDPVIEESAKKKEEQ